MRELVFDGNGNLIRHLLDGKPQPLTDEPPRYQAINLKEWPLWAKALKLLSKPEDKGLGDVIERTIGHENSEAFKAWYLKTFGKSCGCAGRQARLNAEYPL